MLDANTRLLEIVKSIDDLRAECWAYNGIADTLWEMGDVRNAMEYTAAWLKADRSRLLFSKRSRAWANWTTWANLRGT